VSITDGAGNTTEVSYTYSYALGNPHGLRVRQEVSENGGAPVVTTYLYDPMNPTGYEQVLEERTDGQLTKSYVIGHDVIAQIARDAATQAKQTLALLYDAHGNTRQAADELGQLHALAATLAEQIVHTLIYDAPGTAINFAPTTAATSLLYTGDYQDALTGQLYLRARWYDAAASRFGRLDPFSGFLDDPRFLHEYGYVHGSPTTGVDPTGQFKLVSRLVVAAIQVTLTSLVVGAISAGDAFIRGGSSQQVWDAFQTGLGAGAQLGLAMLLPGVRVPLLVGLTALGGAATVDAAVNERNFALTMYRAGLTTLLGAGALKATPGYVRSVRGALDNLVHTGRTPATNLRGARRLQALLYSAARQRTGGNISVKPAAPQPHAKAPAARHRFNQINADSSPRSENGVFMPHVNVKADVAAIHQGHALRIGNHFLVNQRLYHIEANGTLFPIAGEGIVPLGRHAYKALRILRQHKGLTDSARHAMRQEFHSKDPLHPLELQAAVQAYTQATGGPK